MNTLDAIFARKSVRNFCGAPSAEELSTVLKAAYAAPVGRALYDTVHLTVISNAALIGKINEAARVFFNNPEANPMYDAPVYILVSTKLSGTNDNVPYSNCATIVENMVLASVELGLGACHIWGATAALSMNADLVKELNLPEGFSPCCGMIVGKTTEVYTARDIPEGRIATAYIK